jgi:hypothetical protein
MASMMMAKPKLSSLFSESHISAGKLLASPANEAPAPRATIRAGKAQHTKVELPKSFGSLNVGSVDV